MSGEATIAELEKRIAVVRPGMKQGLRTGSPNKSRSFSTAMFGAARCCET
jgi:hypothetical protein